MVIIWSSPYRRSVLLPNQILLSSHLILSVTSTQPESWASQEYRRIPSLSQTMSTPASHWPCVFPMPLHPVYVPKFWQCPVNLVSQASTLKLKCCNIFCNMITITERSAKRNRRDCEDLFKGQVFSLLLFPTSWPLLFHFPIVYTVLLINAPVSKNPRGKYFCYLLKKINLWIMFSEKTVLAWYSLVFLFVTEHCKMCA